MAERVTGRPWSHEEDELLRQAIAVHGENDKWKAVATCVPGRTNKACRKRWLHSLSPAVKKTAWTHEEDELLLSLYAKHGTKWALIARSIPGRTDDACSKRYREALDPNLKKDDWTSEEDARLLSAYARLGGKWSQVGQELQRSGLGCRNRWRHLQRKAMARGDFAGATPEAGPSYTPVHDSVEQDVSWPPMSMLDPTQYWAFGLSSGTMGNNFLPYPTDGHSSPMHMMGQVPTFTPSDLASSLDPTSPVESPFHYTSSSLSHALHTRYSPDITMPRMTAPTSQIPPPPHREPDHSEYRSIAPPASPIILLPTVPTNPPSIPVSMDHLPPQSSTDISTQEDLPTDTHSFPEPDGPTSSIFSSLADGGGFPDSSDYNGAGVTPASAAVTGEAEPSNVDFSSSPYYRTFKPRKKRSTKDPKPEDPPPRLSATLPVSSDASVTAYACGNPDCWPEGAAVGQHVFATSQELVDHQRDAHLNDNRVLVAPYKCGLQGCGKGWKSVNGLQYHLQISRAHFREATGSTTAPGDTATTDASGTSAGPSRPTKKVHPCPHPGCPNSYKQLSGLRYHLTHSHDHTLPVQLPDVPPTLARKMAGPR